jgi:hypothetical protein
MAWKEARTEVSTTLEPFTLVVILCWTDRVELKAVETVRAASFWRWLTPSTHNADPQTTPASYFALVPTLCAKRAPAG